jgi:CubicO group peptidase (beta-lactamase class C family)
LLVITLLALSTVAGGQGSTAPAPTVPAAAGLERAVDDALAAPIRDRKFSGVVLVEKDGRPLLRKAYGLADRSRGTANTPETRFMIMSVSKQFTAALILRLAARGRLRLTDGVGEYLADWPAEWLAVTIHDLLSHSAGIDIDTAYAWLIAHHPEFWEPKAEARPVYTPRGLATPPGTKFLYSNVGYTLLSMIAASAGGKPFDELMREEVFRPLGLKNTEPERGTPVEGRACGYQRSDEGFDFSEQNTVDIVGAADLVSTVDDLAKLDEALADDRFLPAALRSAMFTPHVAGKGGGIGYGWFVRTREDGQALQFHSGSGAGFRAWNYRFPQAGLAVIILSNVGEEDSAWVLVVLDRIVNVLAAEKGRVPSR